MRSHFRQPILALAALALASCVTQQEINDAIRIVNEKFGYEYEQILIKSGTREVAAGQGHAFVALLAALNKLGMNVVNQDLDAGTLTMSAPAPRPLDAAEWQRAAEADLPRMQALVCPIVGQFACQGLRFEPYGLAIEINATIVATAPGRTRVTLTTRMREIAPDPYGRPRREYPPPTAVRMALDKIWGELDREVSGRPAAPR